MHALWRMVNYGWKIITITASFETLSYWIAKLLMDCVVVPLWYKNMHCDWHGQLMHVVQQSLIQNIKDLKKGSYSYLLYRRCTPLTIHNCRVDVDSHDQHCQITSLSLTHLLHALWRLVIHGWRIIIITIRWNAKGLHIEEWHAHSFRWAQAYLRLWMLTCRTPGRSFSSSMSDKILSGESYLEQIQNTLNVNV